MKKFLLWALLLTGVGALLYEGKGVIELIMDRRNGPRWDNLPQDMKDYADAIEREAKAEGLDVGFYDGWRDLNQEQANVASGVSREYDPLDSYHCWGRAIDMVFRNKLGQWYWPDANTSEGMALWKRLGAIGQRLGLTWGGGWKKFFDGAHFQKDDVTVAQLRSEYGDDVLSYLADQGVSV